MPDHFLKPMRRLAVIVGWVVALAVAVAPAPASAASATISGLADTDIYKNEASGRPAQAWLGTRYDALYETRAYVSFAVSGIPAGATVTSATLSLYCDDGSTDGPAIRAVNEFNASTLSWSTQPADAAAVDDDDKGVITAPGTVNFNIARTVRENRTYYFKLYQTGTDFTGCLSMEATSNRPSVSVQYTAAAPASAASATISGLADTDIYKNEASGRPAEAWLGTRYDALYETRAYVSFAVSGIPAGATVTSATLSLYCDDASTDGPAIRAVNEFDASTLSWSTQPADAAAVDDDDKGVITAPGTVNFNIARTVRENRTYYFKLYQTGTDFTGCLSMEAASNRPSVSVRYTAPASERATIAVFGDTQMLAQPIGGGGGVLAGDMERSMTWLQANAAALNLKFLVQLGDLTNGVFQTDATPSTNNLGYTEFQYAKLAMSKLLPSTGSRVPWTVSLGNHDMDEWCWAPNFPAANYYDRRCSVNGLVGTTRTTGKFAATFPQSYFSAMSTWGGGAVGSAASTTKVDNNFHQFTIGGQPWLVIALKWNPDAADLAWARSVIDAHASSKVIIATHAYKYPNGYLSRLTDPGNSSGKLASNGQLIYDDLISQRPAIRLVLSGHNDRGRVYSNDGSKQCTDRTNTATFEKCAWVRYERRTVPASSLNGNVQYTVDEVLTDYSVAADRTDGYTSTTSAGTPVQISRRLDDNNYFRLLTFDPSNKSIRVKTIAAPTNVAVGSTNCVKTTTISPELGTTPLCAKNDAAYDTSQDDYVIANAW
jgi:hypothetical protein